MPSLSPCAVRRTLRVLPALPALLALAGAPAAAAEPALAPAEIVAAAPAGDWVAIAPDDLLVMDLAPDAPGPDRPGRPRRVVIQLMPPPFSQGWIGNIRKLAAAHWWDGLSINRVQDNYVVQWGDGDSEDKGKARALPAGLQPTRQDDYATTIAAIQQADEDEGNPANQARWARGNAAGVRAFEAAAKANIAATRTAEAKQGWHQRDGYAPWVEIRQGWPLAADGRTAPDARFWPLHCYGAVGVGRDMPPDAGTGAELYAVIGTPPRHLDRNIAVVGRVIEGIEHLSSLSRGTGPLGFYQTAAERTGIRTIRLGNEVPDLPRYQYLSTESASFARYVEARANRRDAFFVKPAGGVDICNLPVPVRRAP